MIPKFFDMFPVYRSFWANATSKRLILNPLIASGDNEMVLKKQNIKIFGKFSLNLLLFSTFL